MNLLNSFCKFNCTGFISHCYFCIFSEHRNVKTICIKRHNERHIVMDTANNCKKRVLILGKFGEGSGNNTTAQRIGLNIFLNVHIMKLFNFCGET